MSGCSRLGNEASRPRRSASILVAGTFVVPRRFGERAALFGELVLSAERGPIVGPVRVVGGQHASLAEELSSAAAGQADQWGEDPHRDAAVHGHRTHRSRPVGVAVRRRRAGVRWQLGAPGSGPTDRIIWFLCRTLGSTNTWSAPGAGKAPVLHRQCDRIGPGCSSPSEGRIARPAARPPAAVAVLAAGPARVIRRKCGSSRCQGWGNWGVMVRVAQPRMVPIGAEWRDYCRRLPPEARPEAVTARRVSEICRCRRDR